MDDRPSPVAGIAQPVATRVRVGLELGRVSYTRRDGVRVSPDVGMVPQSRRGQERH